MLKGLEMTNRQLVKPKLKQKSKIEHIYWPKTRCKYKEVKQAKAVTKPAGSKLIMHEPCDNEAN